MVHFLKEQGSRPVPVQPVHLSSRQSFLLQNSVDAVSHFLSKQFGCLENIVN